MVAKFPKVLRLADTLGTPDAVEPDEEVLLFYREEVRGFFNVKPRLRAPPQEGNACEVQGQVLQAWLDRASDPETEIEGWCDDGVGIGINRQIKYCNVFPPVPEEEARAEVPDSNELIETSIDNYASMRENAEDAKIEVERVVKKRFASRISKRRVRERFKGGQASKLAIIVKTKDDGTRKRRLIVDLKRSGRNALAYVAERVVLPRLQDAVFMMLMMFQLLVNGGVIAANGLWPPGDFGVELVSGDFSDAYYHFRIHQSE